MTGTGKTRRLVVRVRQEIPLAILHKGNGYVNGTGIYRLGI